MGTKKSNNDTSMSKASKFIFSTVSFFLFIVIFTRLLTIGAVDRQKDDFSEPDINQVLSEEDEFKTSGSLDSDNTIPENFPKDFPIYDESTIKDSWVVRGEDIEGISVLLGTEENPVEVVNYYISEFDKTGWSRGKLLETETSYTLSFTKDKIDGFLGITKNNEKDTEISITVGVK